jgi:hypothetical protein
MKKRRGASSIVAKASWAPLAPLAPASLPAPASAFAARAGRR